MGSTVVYRKGTLEDLRSSRRGASYGGVIADSIVDVPFPIAVASRILDDIGFNGIIDSSLEWDPKMCKISPGDAIRSIIIHTASVKERPAVMNIHLKYQDLPLDLLFDTVTSPDDLDRFTVSDHLDRLYEAGASTVYGKIAAAVRARYEIVSSVVHSDTTSKHVWGTYEADYQDDGGIDITFGYSKDKRPDLRQYMVGDVVDDNGISIYSKPLDGNTSDVVWNRECIDAMEELLKREDLIYTADSKVMTEDLVRRLDGAGIRFVSRLPANYGDGLQAKVLSTVDESDLVVMEKLPGEEKRTGRRYAERVLECDGIRLRLIPQITDHNRGKGDRAVSKAREDFMSYLGSFRTVYACRKDAEKAFESLQKKVSKKHPMFRVAAGFSEFTTEHRNRGRPRKDGTDIITERYVRIDVGYEEVPEVREALWKSKEFIVTVTNIPTVEEDPDRGMDAEDVIRIYTQQWKVEAQYATLKKPAIADRLFLEKQSRAEALICIFNMGVLLRGLIQLLLRRGLERIPDGALPRYGVDRGPLQRNVTHAYFIQQFESTNIHYYPKAGEYTLSSSRTAERAGFFLSLMGIDISQLFQRT